MQLQNPIVFRSNHKPRFFEIDPYGHLSIVHYLAYFTEHRFRGLAEFCGLDVKQINELNIGFYSSSVTIDFKRPVFLDTSFEITSFVASYDESTAIVECEMKTSEGKIISTCKISLACVDKKSGKACPWPLDVLERFFSNSGD
jgi:YbgC/YbaW family acyl-CoA thioester hydrolase